MEQLVRSFEESVQDPKFRTAALFFGKVLGLPHNIGAGRKYHERLCKDALRRGEKLSKAVLGDYPHLLKAARAKGLLATAETTPQPVAKIETFAKAMRSEAFRESARGWGKFNGIPWGVGAELAYHRHLVKTAMERGEAVPAAVCADHEDLREILRKSRSKESAPVATIKTLAKSMESTDFVRSAHMWGQYKGMPWGHGSERAYHHELVRKAIAKGERVPSDVLADHPDLETAHAESIQKSRSAKGAAEVLKKSRGEIQLSLEELVTAGEVNSDVLSRFGMYGVFGLTDDIKQKLEL